MRMATSWGRSPVSSGLMAQDKLFRETRAGAFLTTDRMINFKSEGYMYNYAIRIDGGNLIHSLGCKLRGAKWDYSEHLMELGKKASHGCVRMDTRMNEQGLNAYWVWTHIPYYTKVLVIDDPRACGTAGGDQRSRRYANACCDRCACGVRAARSLPRCGGFGYARAHGGLYAHSHRRAYRYARAALYP